MLARTPAHLDASEWAASAILKISEENITDLAHDYRWFCKMVQEEELFFAREDRYRYSTFQETLKNVYSDDVFMDRYMNGLFLCHVIWWMFSSSLFFFTSRMSARLKSGSSVLEVGPGHGLLLYMALERLGAGHVEGWDLSPVSLDQTRNTLSKLGYAAESTFLVRDMNSPIDSDKRFDLIILSHLLEHLERPVEALQNLRGWISKGGNIFVNIPINAPLPDHLILLRHPDEVQKLIEDGGFRIVEMSCHTTENISISRALKRKSAITCSLIAEPA
ncbi:MAG: class I SAM-dependent methyltransferase [Novosphingobium sp.]|nr:class I SAM-dependent methyltransferase [Novosphingobium sp.]